MWCRKNVYMFMYAINSIVCCIQHHKKSKNYHERGCRINSKASHPWILPVFLCVKANITGVLGSLKYEVQKVLSEYLSVDVMFILNEHLASLRF